MCSSNEQHSPLSPVSWSGYETDTSCCSLFGHSLQKFSSGADSSNLPIKKRYRNSKFWPTSCNPTPNFGGPNSAFYRVSPSRLSDFSDSGRSSSFSVNCCDEFVFDDENDTSAVINEVNCLNLDDVPTPTISSCTELSCPICNKTFSCTKSHRSHLRRCKSKRDGIYKCQHPFCNKTFVQRSSLQNHQAIHLPTKQYKCPQCSLETNDQSTFTKHLRVHSGEKPFKCLNAHCSKYFSQSGNMRRHLKTCQVSSS